MAEIKSVGILTSGGDAPGMNAAIRAVTRAAIYNGLRVFGIRRGYQGLIEDRIEEFRTQNVSNIISRGGTILKTARSAEFKTPEGRAKAYENMQKHGIDSLVVIGGDGSITGASFLAKEYDVPIVGLPGTIDNDLAGTDVTIGYDTAMNTVIEMIDRLRDTCESHARCNVVEVMGNHAGGIAINTAIACGAVDCVIAEQDFNEEALYAKMNRLKADGKRGFIVVVSELIPGFADPAFAKKIQEKTGVETKFARLAHVVRGGDPTLRDRVAAAQFGARAVKELLDGKSNIVVVEQNNEIVTVDINFAQTTDRIYKGKAAPEEIEKYNADEQKVIMATVEKKRQYFRDMTALLAEISG